MRAETQPGRSGAIDLGGTKIEARLFDAALQTLSTRRLPTPRDDFDPFIAALSDQIRWLEAEAGDPALPVSLAMAGVVDPLTGRAFAANLPITGRNVGAALERAAGRRPPIFADSLAFTWSEAHGGAGDGAESVLGLVLGTGLGAGFVTNADAPERAAGRTVEIGHASLPARALARHGLPLWPCGCGREGCIETIASGSGLARLAAWRGLAETDPARLVVSDDPTAREVMAVWLDVAGEVLDTLRLILDPAVIVLGGGLSNMPDLPERLSAALAARRMGEARPPAIRRAVHGDSSGARGAALMARMGAPC